MKYRVGDRVRIKSDIKDGTIFSNGLVFTGSVPLSLLGKTVTINYVNDLKRTYYILGFGKSVELCDEIFDELIERKATTDEVLKWLSDKNETDEMFKVFAEKDVDGVLKNYTPEEVSSKIALYEFNKKYPKDIKIEWVYRCEMIDKRDHSKVAIKYFTEEEFPKAAEDYYKNYVLQNSPNYFLEPTKICWVK